jgi:hypothetical protein
MNRAKIKALIKQYKTDPSIIFAMPAIVQEVDCGSAFCIAGQVCINEGYRLIPKEHGLAIAVRGEQEEDAWNLARNLLELCGLQALNLFNKGRWPADLCDQPDTPALAAERLQRFLDTDGHE